MMDGHMMPADDSIAMMMMQMTFYAGVDCTVLIKQWKVNKTVLKHCFVNHITAHYKLKVLSVIELRPYSSYGHSPNLEG